MSDLYSLALAYQAGFQKHITDKSNYENPIAAWFKNQPLNA